MNENPPIVDEFLNYLNFERHFSPHTAKCYSADLQQFCQFLSADTSGAALDTGVSRTIDSATRVRVPFGGGTPNSQAATTITTTKVTLSAVQQTLLKVDPEEVRRFLMFLDSKDYSKSTTASKLATLRIF